MSERSLDNFEEGWPLVGITFSVLAIFTSVTILMWFLLQIFYIP
jgi:hypothetical protein